MSSLLLLGATSAISRAYLDKVGKQFSRIVLVARSGEKLEHVAQHMRVSFEAQVLALQVDLADVTAHQRIFSDAASFVGSLDQVVICYGDLTDQVKCKADVAYAIEQFTLNATSTISLSAYAAQALVSEGGGDLVVVGSVAGDRGRKSNYVYGAAKGAVAIYLAGLGMDMEASNVRVLTVKPGFVDSPMTAHLKKGMLWSTPDKVAKDIANAVDRQTTMLYTPWFWRSIMLMISLLPRAILKRLPI